MPLGDEVVLLRYGRGRRIDTAAYLGACAKVVTDAGGEILCSVETDTLVVDGGEVRGVDLRTADGARRLDGRSTLLASGGYQGDRELITTLIHANAS